MLDDHLRRYCSHSDHMSKRTWNALMREVLHELLYWEKYRGDGNGDARLVAWAQRTLQEFDN